MYLNIQPTISNWAASGDEFSLIFDNNPLTEFVELPQDIQQLRYSSIICGCIRGALEMVQLEVQCWFSQDQLKGDASTEIRVKFVRRLEDAIPGWVKIEMFPFLLGYEIFTSFFQPARIKKETDEKRQRDIPKYKITD